MRTDDNRFKSNSRILVVGLMFAMGWIGFLLGSLFCRRSGDLKTHLDGGELIEDSKSGAAKIVSYENIVGTWVLTDRSCKKLEVLVSEQRDLFARNSNERNLHIDEFTLLMMLGGRHFRLYNQDCLMGVIHKWPPPPEDVSFARGRYDSKINWSRDKRGNELLDSRDIDYGLDLPVNSVVWAIRKAPSERGLESKQGNYVVISKENNPDMWGENYYNIILEENGFRLTRTFENLGGLTDITLEWRKRR